MSFLVQFTALVLWESLSYPRKIVIVTEISLTESILNRTKSNPDLVNQTKIIRFRTSMAMTHHSSKIMKQNLVHPDLSLSAIRLEI